MTSFEGARSATAAFVDVSAIPAYRSVNVKLVDLLSPKAGEAFLDVGCGTGMVLSLVLEQNDPPEAVGIDADPMMVEIARRQLGPDVRIERGDVTELSELLGEGAIDCATAANCIHLFDDIDGALAAIVRVLRPGGRLGVNTAFFTGAAPESDRALYGRLLLDARRLARAAQADQTSARPRRGNAVRRELTPGYFVEAFERAGLEVVRNEQVTVSLPPEFVVELVTTPMFAGSVLPDVPIEVAVSSMRGAAAKLAENSRYIERSWLFLIAHKKGTDDGNRAFAD